MQNLTARLLTHANRRSHITSILKSLHWLHVQHHIHLKILVLTFRTVRGQAPVQLFELLNPYSTSRSLRSSEQSLLMVPRTLFKTR